MASIKIDDVNIHYKDLGDANSKVAVVFFNGVMASTSSWKDFYPTFVKSGYRVVLHDFMGQLLSDKPDKEYSFNLHCYQAFSLFRSLGIEKIHIIGTSYGGEIAMRYAVLYPDMVESITVIDSTSQLDPVMIGFINSWKTFCDIGDGRLFFENMLPSIYGEKYLEENQDTLAKRSEKMSEIPADYLKGQKILYDTFLRDVSCTKDLYKIGCPALIICGEHDLLKPVKYSKIIADNIPGSEFIVLPDCGHVAIFEKPKEINSLILGFVIKHSS